MEGEVQEPHEDGVAHVSKAPLLIAEVSAMLVDNGSSLVSVPSYKTADSEPHGHVLIGAQHPTLAPDNAPESAVDASDLSSRKHRKKEPSVRLHDYVNYTTRKLSLSICAPTQ